jgi:KamA family protein
MSWNSELRNNITTIDQLSRFIDMTQDEKNRLKKVIERHPMSITRYYLSLVNKDDPEDPIRKLVIPRTDELVLSGSYDTSGEIGNTVMQGLQHKYRPTVLLLVTNRCASYCRYCFRKRLIGLPTEEVLHRFKTALKYVMKHREVTNVLMSGGDPFILPTRVIGKFLNDLWSVSHLKYIRFGTRIPVVFPERILDDDELITVLRSHFTKERRIHVVTQFNHPRELTEKALRCIYRLHSAGAVINNQTVLLKGVNDDPEVLSDLLKGLVRIGIGPYYVFQCRPVKRVKQQFQLPLWKGYEIVENAKERLDGHSKRFRYVMSHRSGKIEILGKNGDNMYFKYHQAKNPANMGKFFTRKLTRTGGWLEDLEAV